MAKKSRLGDDPFEKFLPQIQDSRKKKDDDTSDGEGKSKDDSNGTIISEDKSTDKSANTDTSKSTSKSASKTKDEGKSASARTSKDASNVTSKDISADASTGTIASTAVSADAVTDASAGAITIPRRMKTSSLVKMTYYFRPDQLIAIDDLHEKSGRDKSELVRMAVDILIERARVE